MGHFLEVQVSEDDETCLYCHCDVTRGQGVKTKEIDIHQDRRQTTYDISKYRLKQVIYQAVELYGRKDRKAA